MDFLPSGGFAVSIQLVSPASGELALTKYVGNYYDSAKVSIQLVSPASGEVTKKANAKYNASRFHSISFPSEWGVQTLCYGSNPPEGTLMFPFN